MIEVISILVSIIFFVNKILILVGKKSGWLVGCIAALLAILYFLLIELYILTVLEFGLVILMGYGFLVKEELNPKVEKFIHLTIFIVMTVLAFFAFTGLLTVYEFFAAIFMLLGTYYLTHNKKSLGWFIYGCAHLFAAYVTGQKDQQFFADFQIASAIVSAVGFFINFKKEIQK